MGRRRVQGGGESVLTSSMSLRRRGPDGNIQRRGSETIRMRRKI